MAPVVVTVPVPLTALAVHAPVPVVGVVAAKVAVVKLHKFCVLPAAAVDGRAATTIFTLALDEQVPLVTVHLKVLVLPIVKPVTPELIADVVVTVPVPAVALAAHAPVPVVGVVAAKVAVVALHKFCVLPALATLAGAST